MTSISLGINKVSIYVSILYVRKAFQWLKTYPSAKERSTLIGGNFCGKFLGLGIRQK